MYERSKEQEPLPVEQLEMRLSGLENRPMDFARLQAEHKTGGDLYFLPTGDGDFVLAADVDPDKAGVAPYANPVEVMKHGSRSALLGDSDYWHWFLIDQLVRNPRSRLNIPAGMEETEALEMIVVKNITISGKLAINTVGAIATGLVLDVASSLSTPMGTETALVGLQSYVNSSIMRRTFAIFDSLPIDRFKLMYSDELADVQDLLERQGVRAAVRYLDDVDGIPEPGFTADRLNLAEMLTSIDSQDPNLVKRISAASKQISLLLSVNWQNRHFLKPISKSVDAIRLKAQAILSKYHAFITRSVVLGQLKSTHQRVY